MGAFVSPWPALVPEGHAGEVDAIATVLGGLRAGYAHPRGWPAKPNDPARPDLTSRPTCVTKAVNGPTYWAQDQWGG